MRDKALSETRNDQFACVCRNSLKLRMVTCPPHFCEIQFSRLSILDTLFYRIFYNISENLDISVLSDSLNPSNSLGFNYWVPLRLQNIHIVGDCKVETFRPGSSCHYKDPCILACGKMSADSEPAATTDTRVKTNDFYIAVMASGIILLLQESKCLLRIKLGVILRNWRVLFKKCAMVTKPP